MNLYEFDPNEEYATVGVQGHMYLFSDMRIDRATVPLGLYIYDVADGDGDGCFARIQPHVMVNYLGTIIGTDEIKLDNGVYYPEYGSDEYEGWFGDAMTLDEYMHSDRSFEFGPVRDGENAVFPGKAYEMRGRISLPQRVGYEALTANIVSKPYDEAVKEFKEIAKDYLGSEELTIHRVEVKPDGQTAVRFTPAHVIRTMEICDQLMSAADEAGLVWECDWPSASLVAEGEPPC